MITFILVVQNKMPEELTFTEIAIHDTLYVFILVRDPLQALQIVQTFKPDCFLLEEKLPQTNGLQLYAEIHNQRGLEEIPTIIFVAAEHNESIQLADIPQLETLVKIIDKTLLLPSKLLLYSYSTSAGHIIERCN